MRRFVTVGIFSAIGALVWACSDDGGSLGGIGGTGGSAAAGTGGSAGVAGDAGGGGSSTAGSSSMAGNGGSSTAGSTGMSGASGAAGTGGTGVAGSGTLPDAGDAGSLDGDASVADGGDAAPPPPPPPPCTGCLELTAPLAAAGDSAYFQLGFSARDLSDTVATFRLRTLALDNTGQTIITPFVQDSADSGYTQGNGTSVSTTAGTFTDTETFIDVQLDVGAIVNTDLDKTQIIGLGIQLYAGGTYAGPAPDLLLDSVTFTGSAGFTDLTFTNDAEGFAVNQYAGTTVGTVTHH